jgi:hypothetical protein
MGSLGWSVLLDHDLFCGEVQVRQGSRSTMPNSGVVGPGHRNPPSSGSDRLQPPRRDGGLTAEARSPIEEQYLQAAYSEDDALPKPQILRRLNRSLPDPSTSYEDAAGETRRRHGHTDRFADRLGRPHGSNGDEAVYGSAQVHRSDRGRPDDEAPRDSRREKHHRSKRDRIGERLGPRHGAAEEEGSLVAGHIRRGEHRWQCERSFSSASGEVREHVQSRGHGTERERSSMLQGTMGLRSDKLFSRQ